VSTLIRRGVAYFRIRRIFWSGEKEAIRYFQQHDPEYLDLFERCRREQDRTKKVQLYEALVQLTAAPLGETWQRGVTAFSFAPGAIVEPGTLDQVYAFWQHLITE